MFSTLPGYRQFSAAARWIAVYWSRPLFQVAVRGVLTLLFVVIVNKSVAGADLASLARSITPFGLISALVLGTASLYFQMLRWRCILRQHGLPSGTEVALRTMFKGFFLGFVTPGRMGELFRTLHLDPQRKIAGITATVEERFCAVAVTVGAGIVAMMVQRWILGRPLFFPLTTASVLFSAGVLLLVVVMRAGADRTLKNVTLLQGIRPVLDHLERCRSFPFFRLAAYSVAAHLLLLFQTALLFFMFGERNLPVDLTAAAQAFSFMLLLPFFIANIGLREYAFSFFLARAQEVTCSGLSCGAVALGVATIILFINIIFPAGIGLFWVFLEKRTDQRTAAAKGDHDNTT